MPGFATLAMLNLDCADPPALAAFYHEVLGWEITHSEADYAMISDGQTSLGFGRIEGYQPPAWPESPAPKRYHLDFYVDDLDKAEERSRELGASTASVQPEPARWRVMIDPAGHPFCLCPKAT